MYVQCRGLPLLPPPRQINTQATKQTRPDQHKNKENHYASTIGVHSCLFTACAARAQGLLPAETAKKITVLGADYLTTLQKVYSYSIERVSSSSSRPSIEQDL